MKVSRQRVCLLILVAFGSISARQSNPESAKPEEVVFQSSKLQLHGFLWKPEGQGPFPAVLWNHGSEKLPGSQPALAAFYTAHDYVFFAPHRRGQGRSPGEYIQDLMALAPPRERSGRMVQLQEAEVEDVVAALNLLKSQAFVDPTRIAISGCSYGGIQTLLTGERALDVKALIPFAPAAMSWEGNPLLQDRLKHAVDQAKAPYSCCRRKMTIALLPAMSLVNKQTRGTPISSRRFIPPSATATRMDIGSFARPRWIFGVAMCWHFWKPG